MQGLALHQLQNQAVHFTRLLEAIDRGNVGVVQGSQRARLPAQTSQPLRIAGELGGQGFDGDIATELAIVGAVYLAHAACA